MANSRERLREIDKDARTAEVELQRAENEIERLKDEIAGQDTAELARKRVLQTEALKEEGRLTQSINDVRRDIDNIKEELAVAQKAIESLAPARSKRSTLKVSVATDLERTFAASIEDLRDRLRERVGSLANDAFKKMTTQKEYRGLEINSNYGLSMMDSAGRKVPLRSAGAEQVLALSLIDPDIDFRVLYAGVVSIIRPARRPPTTACDWRNSAQTIVNRAKRAHKVHPRSCRSGLAHGRSLERMVRCFLPRISWPAELMPFLRN
jgi:hypothetical protein